MFQHGNTALHEAAWKGFSQSVSVLCKAKANFYIKNRGGFAPLHLCCQNGHNETCRVLLLNGCKPDLKNNVSRHFILVKNNCFFSLYRKRRVIYNVYIYLSARCANLMCNFQYGDTPLHTSARYGHAGVIRILVSARCNVSEQNKVSLGQGVQLKSSRR